MLATRVCIRNIILTLQWHMEAVTNRKTLSQNDLITAPSLTLARGVGAVNEIWRQYVTSSRQGILARRAEIICVGYDLPVEMTLTLY